MKGETVYKTELKNINKSFSALVKNKLQNKHYKEKRKDNGSNIFILRFNASDKEQAFKKFHIDVDTIILSQECKTDQVYLVLNSPGGSVTAYADAAQQIVRLKNEGFKVTCFVDEVAASGGYMMAAVCNEIVAQPFAFVGSIGVVAQMPIIEELLKRNGIQFNTYTAGTKKRSIVPTKKPTLEEESVFNQKLKDIHTAFKRHVLKYRPQINEEKLMDGDYYMAQDVIHEKIVDKIGDSHSSIIKAFKEGYNLIEVITVAKKKSTGILSLFGVDSAVENVLSKYLDKVIESSHPNQLFK